MIAIASTTPIPAAISRPPSFELCSTSMARAARASSASNASATSSRSAGISGSSPLASGLSAPATERAQARPAGDPSRNSRVAARCEAVCWPSM